MKGLVNHWMDTVLRCFQLKEYGGIYSANNVPFHILLQSNYSIICNLSDSDQEGTHFTTICKRQSQYFLLDSIGLNYDKLPTHLKEIVPPNIHILYPNSLQPITSSACGFYCLQFILQNDSLITAPNLKPFSNNVDLNDQICLENLLTIIRNNPVCNKFSVSVR